MSGDSMLPVYVRALAKALPFGARGSTVGPSEPGRTIDRSIPLDPVAYAGFTSAIGARLSDVVHPGYLHVLAFPLSMQLLSGPEVELPLLGMVHIRNQIEMHRPVRLGEVIDVHVSLAGPFSHSKGTSIDVCVSAASEGQTVFTETSTYLAKGRKVTGIGTAVEPPRETFSPVDPRGLWRLDPVIARRYARASGDYNPIHLSSMAARAFGFPRTIAHGMYCACRALSAVEPRLPAYRWDVSFATPVLLPSTVGFAMTSGRRGAESRATVFNPTKGKPHVFSSVAALG